MDNLMVKEFKEYKRKSLKLFKKNEYNKLIEKIDVLLNKYNYKESNNFLLIQKGECYFGLKKFDEAIKCYKESLRYDESEINYVKEQIAVAYYYGGQKELAKKSLIDVIDRGTDDPMIVVYLLELFIKEKKFDDAYDYIKKNHKKLNYFLGDPDYLLQCGRIFKALKRYKESINCFKESFRNGLDLFNHYEDIGDSYFELKDYQNALKYYNKLKWKDRKYPDVYKKLSKLYKTLGNMKKAEYFNKKYKKIEDKEKE